MKHVLHLQFSQPQQCNASNQPKLTSTGTNQGLFNNAAQSWNHAFYWDCMKANGGGVATGKIAAMIDKQFGSYDKFKTEFTNAGKLT